MSRTLLLLLCAVVAPVTSAYGEQPADAACHPVSPTSRVVVTMHDGAKVAGSLLCLDDQDVLLASDGRMTRRPLADVRRIDTPRDSVHDGFLKGAAVGLIFWGVLCRGCDAEYMLRTTATYALIGLSVDALQGNSGTIYRSSPRAASVVWRVRF